MFNKLNAKAGRVIIRSLEYIRRKRKKHSTMWIYYDGDYFKFNIEYIGCEKDEDEENEDEEQH